MSESDEVRAITALMKNAAFSQDVLAILNALGSFRIAQEVAGACNSGLARQIVDQNFAQDVVEILLTINALEEVDGRVRMTDLGYQAYRPLVHESFLSLAGPGAICPEDAQ